MRSQKSSTQTSYGSSQSWTDDVPVCKNTGIGYSTNQIYREDGSPQEEHPYEDCSSHFMFGENFYWYAVFDGHEGKRAADYCSQKMAADIYFSQLNEARPRTDEEVKEILRQAFISVEKGYMESLGDLLAERTILQYEIPDGLNSFEAYQRVPHVFEQIKRLNGLLASGTAAAVALVYNNKLYVANVGTCRVLLCQTDSNNVLKVVQLSVDHDLKNEDELLRLSQIGIKTAYLRNTSHLGNQENTRCLGNYLVKGGFKEFEDLITATQEPVIAEPDIHGGITLDESCRFLLLMSSGLYRSIEQATGTDHVNKYIAYSVVEQYREQATITGVAQAVVDKAVRLHHDWYMSNTITSSCGAKREDITLLLRNFNYELPNAIRSPTAPSVRFNPVLNIDFVPCSTQGTLTNSDVSTFRSDDRSSSCEEEPRHAGCVRDKRIDPYVDFSDFYRNYEIAKKNGTLPEGLDF